jgi:hypothetical protein
MAKGDTYSVSRYNGQYAVTKYDKLGGEGDVYFVTQDFKGDTCTCYASNKQDCRHRQMVRIFQDKKRVDSDWRFNYDEKIEAKRWRSIKS